jgi:hypothetical protein
VPLHTVQTTAVQVCAFPSQAQSGAGTRPPPPHAVHCFLLVMAAPVAVASHLVAFTRSAPITARSGSRQGPGPEGTSKMLWPCEGPTAAKVVRRRKRERPKDLGILDGARGGLILLRRVKVSPGLAVSAERKQRTGGC